MRNKRPFGVEADTRWCLPGDSAARPMKRLSSPSVWSLSTADYEPYYRSMRIV
jgi:hypothetical protein